MDISIIMPTHNNCVVLRRTLSSFCNLSVSRNLQWELVIISNNCTDNTDGVITSYSDQLPITLCHQAQQGTTIARNSGLLRSTGKLIIFTDDDVQPDPNWIEIYWHAYKERSSGFFWGGPVISAFETNPPSEILRRYAPPSVVGLNFGELEKVIEYPEYFIGANWALSKLSLDMTGLLNENLGLIAGQKVRIGEETELMDRLRKNGYRGLYLPEARIFHYVPTAKTTLKHIASRKEACEYFWAMNEFSYQGLTSVPKWMFRRIIEKWILWQGLKIARKDYVDVYMEYRTAVGRMRAALDCVRNISKQNA